MNQAEQVAVTESPESAASTEEQKPQQKPKTLPPYAVIVMNDDLHSFTYVVDTFMKVFGYNRVRSWQHAFHIHRYGRGVVWSGSKEVAELKRDQILGAGPDLTAAKKVDFPLGVVIEPLPG